MPTTEGYNGAYTGQQIDAAIAKANSALQNPPGGTPGQLLSKTENGQEWVDKPVMYVHVTESDGTYNADKTFEEIQAAYNAGYAIFAVAEDQQFFQLIYIVPGAATFESVAGGADTSIAILSSGSVSITNFEFTRAKSISFTPGEKGLTSTNVQDAIEEVAATSATVTLTTSGWTGDAAPYSQQVACSIVKEDTPVVSVDVDTPGTDADADAEAINAWALVSQRNPMQGNGTLGFYCNEKPTVNIPVKVGVS